MNDNIIVLDWIVTGHELISWINDLEFFDIRPTPASETFALRLNHMGTATTLYLGESSTVAEAVGRAAQHLAGFIQEEITCEHGRTLDQSCEDCLS